MAITFHFLNDDSPIKFRHELKYLIDSKQVSLFKNQLADLMKKDSHAGSKGYYQIRSVYFDDWKNTYYYENENGTEPREKIRIRIYDGSSDIIHLELKRKEQGMIHKRSCSLTKDLTEAILLGQPIPWDDNMDPLLKKFYILRETRLLQPKVIVEYDRIPFVYPDGNVRITLDLNVRASLAVERFLDPDIADMRPIAPTGIHLLEAKYDQFMPDFIFRSFQQQQLQRVTYSKYYLCRKYGGIV